MGAARRAPAASSVVELGGGEGQLAAAILGSWEAERPELRGNASPTASSRWGQGCGPGRQRPWRRLSPAAGRSAGARPSKRRAPAPGRWSWWATSSWTLYRCTWSASRTEGLSRSSCPVHVRWAILEQTWGAGVGIGRDRTPGAFRSSRPGAAGDSQFRWFHRAVPRHGGLAAAGGRRHAGGQPGERGLWRLVLGGRFAAANSAVSETGALRKRTVRGYFKQQLVADILARPGRQDLTADVDFAALDLHGRREGFETVLFTTLSAFLTAGGAEQELETARRSRRRVRCP